MESKPYNEQSAAERLASLNRIQNVLCHADWSEMYLMFNDAARQAQQEMDHAANWETFVAARAVKLYVQEHLMNLRERVKDEKESLEADIAALAVEVPPEDL